MGDILPLGLARKMQNAKCRMQNGEWRMENGEWRMENGEGSEKNIYKQLAQLATARGATETNISRMLLLLTLAVGSLHKCKMYYKN